MIRLFETRFTRRRRLSRVRCLACDLDGTLLSSNNTIPDSVLSAIEDARGQGIRIILASGRPDGFVRKYAREIGSTSPVISLNGAMVKDVDGYVLSESHLPPEVASIAQSVGSMPSAAGLTWSLFTSDGTLSLDEKPTLPRYLRSDAGEFRCVSDLRPYHSLAVLLCAGGPYRAIQQLSVAIASRFGNRIRRAMYQSGGGGDVYYLEICGNRVNKALGLKTALESLGIDRKETAAIGDYSNDLEMCKFAGVSAAMRNGFKDLKTVADFVTRFDNNDGGVGEFLRMMLDSRNHK
ncbi:MAG: HAD family hydrolase [Bacteroidota bacterium]